MNQTLYNLLSAFEDTTGYDLSDYGMDEEDILREVSRLSAVDQANFAANLQLT